MSHDITHIVDRAFMFVAVADAAAANIEAAGWDPDTDGAETFGEVWLSPSGDAPATHYGASSAVNASMQSAIQTATSLAGLFWESDPQDWPGALTNMSLQVIDRGPVI